MKKIVFSLIVLLMLCSISFAAKPYAPEPSLIGHGARVIGMGVAFSGLSDDTNAIFSNPAGLYDQKEWSFTSMSTKLLQNIDYTMIGGTYTYGLGTLGIGYTGTSMPGGFEYNEFGTMESSTPISHNSSSLLLSYGLNMNKIIKTEENMGDFAVGGTLKFLSKDIAGIEGASASGMGFDIGIILNPENSSYRYGLTLKNIGGSLDWSTGQKESLEQSTNLGACVKVLGKNGLYIDDTIPGNLIATGDINFLSGSGLALFLGGLEYTPTENFALRLGFNQEPETNNKAATNFTAGVGIYISGFKFDYAYQANSEAEELTNHYFSLSFSPDQLLKKEVSDKDEDEGTNIIKETEPEESTNIYELPEEYRNIYLD